MRTHAKRTGKTGPYPYVILSKIENGNPRPSIKVLDRIVQSLGLRLVVDFADHWEVD